MKNHQLLLSTAAFALFSSVGFAKETKTANYNDFDLNKLTIDKAEIKRPLPKDAIPAINNPKFTSASKIKGIKDDDLVLSFSHNGVHRAYPLRILDFHEVVNDEVGGKKVSITYCPLCGTGVAFDRTLGKDTITLGVSGLLYRSDVLLYDKETNSLFSQLKMEGVAGKHAGKKLKVLASPLVSFGEWKEKHPEAEVLNFETGFRRPYFKTAYKEYKESDKMHKKYALSGVRDDLPVKTWVIGIKNGTNNTCVTLEKLEKLKTFKTKLGKDELIIKLDGTMVTATLNGKEHPTVRSYWFAWQGFYPKTTVHK